jgi:class 3 adenylate cyclase
LLTSQSAFSFSLVAAHRYAIVGRMDIAQGFEQRGRWRRFREPVVERAYREWHRDQVLPIVRAIGFGSAAVWALIPVGYRLGVSEMPRTLIVGCWAIAVPTLAAFSSVSYTRFGRRWATKGAALANVVVGLDIAALMATLYGPISGTVTCGVLGMVFFPLILRLRTIETAFVVSILAAVPIALMIRGTASGEIAAPDSFPYILVVGGVAPLLLAGAALIESGMRQQFVAKTELAANQRLIRRYVPSAVATHIESGKSDAVGVPQRLRVTALSSDVAGFTVLADRLDPESLSHIINEYVGAMSAVVECQGGVITEFAGDGLMAIFGAPEQREPVEQVQQALAVAKGMHQRLAELNQSWFHLGIEQPLKVRIGINTGVLSVGTFGSDGRGTYTAIGLQMNIAARIQAQCEPGSTLLSSSSWHLVKDEVSCEPLGEVSVKGVHFPINIYSPNDRPN